MECYAGHTYPQRPLAVWWQGLRLPVSALEAESRTPQGREFRVRVEDERRFQCTYAEAADAWTVDLIFDRQE